MPNVSPGRPFNSIGGDNYPLPSPADRTAAELQRSGLFGSAPSRRRAHGGQHQLIQRRLRPGGLLTSTGARLKQLIDETGQPLLTLNEIVVRTADLDGRSDDYRGAPMSNLMAGYQLDQERSVAAPGPRHAAVQPGADHRRIDPGGRGAALAGYQASMNQVEPLGYVTKDDRGRREPSPRGAGSPSARDARIGRSARSRSPSSTPGSALNRAATAGSAGSPPPRPTSTRCTR